MVDMTRFDSAEDVQGCLRSVNWAIPPEVMSQLEGRTMDLDCVL